jgi:curved DNA-binding protein CbpA
MNELPGEAVMKDDPFGTLGLPARADLSDDEVRAAWKRIAAATHPDRDDGGDPAWFGAAAAAYDTLRTSFGRGETLADLRLAGTAAPAGRRGARHARSAGARRLGVGGRGRRIALRAAAAAGVTTTALLAVGWTPATVGLLAGALTWAAVTSRRDLPGRGERLPGTSTRRAAPGIAEWTKMRDTKRPHGGVKYPASEAR